MSPKRKKDDDKKNKTEEALGEPIPEPVDESSGGIYIGVPDDYRVPTTVNAGFGEIPVQKKPKYKTGGENRQLAGKSASYIFGLQARLVNLGLLGEEGWIPGSPDPTTVAAFKDLLGIANRYGKSWEETLALMESNTEETGIPGVGGAERQPLTVELTAPTDLASAGREVGRDVIGRNPDDADLMRFAAEYQGTEAAAQTQAYGMAETGGTVTAPPSAGAAAEEFLRRTRPGEARATDTVKAMETFFAMLDGSAR